MKRTSRKLGLSKTTLRNLSLTRLGLIAGGAAVAGSRFRCEAACGAKSDPQKTNKSCPCHIETATCLPEVCDFTNDCTDPTTPV